MELHPDPHALESEIAGLNICDSQYALANKVPYEHLTAQKLLNKATIEGRAHGAAMARWGMYRPMLKTVHKQLHAQTAYLRGLLEQAGANSSHEAIPMITSRTDNDDACSFCPSARNDLRKPLHRG